MKLTKKLEAEILKVYKGYWDAYLNGDMRSFGSMLDDDISVFGTAVSEVFNNKKETLRFYKATADQLVGKVQFRNRKIKLKTVDNNVLVNEQFDLFFLMENIWTFYGHMRVSAILKPTGKGWKVIQHHASFPDLRAGEGEQMAAEKIKAENVQLRDAVKRRTVELEQKNRELEIESSLEKVRAQALGMHKPDDLLNVCKVLFKELSLLGFSELRNAIIHTFNDKQKYFIDYDYSDLTGGVITNIPYSDQPVIKRFLKQIRKSDEAFAEMTVKGKELSEWKKFRKSGGQPDDPRLDKASALYYYCHSVGTSDIGISTFSSINEEKIQLLKRFRNVFDFAYRRYLDIAQAEAQTREAQIEVAIERVRARALAMHRSEDLHEVVRVLRNELLGLKLDGVTAATIYLKQSDGRVRLWDLSGLEKADGNFSLDIVFRVSELDPKLWIRKIWNSKKKYVVPEQGPEDFKRMLKWLAGHNKKVAEEIKEVIKARKIKHGWHPTVQLANGKLSTDFIKEPPAETEPILLKMAAAFDLAYKRFLDLQNAEVQAREARIETALEKVRSRSLAMHKSEEMQSVIDEVFARLRELQVELDTANILIFTKGSENLEAWTASSQSSFGTRFLVPVSSAPHFSLLTNAMKNGQDLVTNTYNFQEKNKWFNYLFEHTDYKNIPEERKQFILNSPCFTVSVGISKNICIQLNSYSREAFTADENNILVRFAKVFEQSYTRFLDLQKAEAQAREAKIEAALERVRSRSMGMQKSDELKEVIRVVYEQFGHLNIHVEHTGFIMDYKTRDDMHIWLADKHAVPFQVTIPYFDCAHWNSFRQAKEKGFDFFANQLSFEEKNKFYQDLFKLIPGVPEETLEYYFSCPGLAISTVLLENVGLYIENFSGIPYTDEENKTLMRFGKVFQQTYTRFLDLQKAEAQAREAQIETALEKVRSHTMGMRSSDDLANVATVMFDQMRILGGDLFSFGIVLCDKHVNMVEQWHSIPHAGMLAPFFVPVDLDHIHRFRYDQWKAGVELFSIVIPEDYITHHFDLMLELPSVKAVWEGIAAKGIPLPPIPTWEIDYGASFRYGYLLVSALKPFEEDKIFPRFAKVFEQAYTRFLDLQKVEAQAREAKIETGLERVRSRSLAMHTTSELQEVIHTVHKELLNLGIAINGGSFIAINSDIDATLSCWGSGGTANTSEEIHVPLYEKPFCTNLINRIRKGPGFFTEEYTQQEKKEFFTFLFKHEPWSKLDAEQKKKTLSSPGGYTRSCFVSQHTSIFIINHFGEKFTAADNDILQRFGKVFEQSYTRFLDLQKAEAQAREGQIELGLERVRARAMAMQNSDELKELIGTVFTELTKLDLVLTRCLIVIFDPKTNGSTWWMANSEAPSDPIGLYVKYHDHPPYLSYVKAWQERNLKWQYILEGKDKKEWDDFLFVETELSHLPDFVIAGMKAPDRVYLNASFNSFGNLTLASLEPLSDEHFDILLRFAKVFDLTYTRFNDLKQAEAQAREAQIELGLERVRARAMAMQKSDELSELVDTVFKELTKLDFALTWCIINIIDESSLSNTVWAANPDINKPPESYHMLFEDYPFHHAMMRGWKERKTKDVYVLEGQEKKVYDEYLFNETEFRRVPAEAQAASRAMEKYVVTFSFSNFGGLQTVGDVPLSDANLDILSRFGKVFDLTYTRFNDLKHAEAQARESQVQLALERVRARTMAMQKSEELMETAVVLFDQLKQLGEHIERTLIGVVNEEEAVVDFWATRPDGSQMEKMQKFPIDEPIVMQKVLGAWRQQKKSILIDLQGEELENYFQFMQTRAPRLKRENFGERRVESFAFFSKGILGVISVDPKTPANVELYERFAAVFEQTYTRFLDLQKAEAQTREAQIEAALERVRSRTMAMQKSEELPEAANVLFLQVQSLGIPAWSCGYNILAEDNKSSTCIMSSEGEIQVPFELPLTEHSSMLPWYEAIQNNLDFFVCEQGGEDLIEHYKYLATVPGLEQVFRQFDNAGISLPTNQINHLVRFTNGFLLFITYESVPHAHDIFKRFGKVFEQTYTRFLDLQKAEAQAREAVKQASVDRIRAEIASMRTTNDLERIQPIIWNELTTLGVPFTRCGVFILDEEHERVDTFLSTPEGKSIASFTSNYSDVQVISEALPYWRRKEIFKTHWDEATFLAQAKTLLARGNITSTETYLTEHRPKDLYLHFLPFLQGILYVGNETPLDEEELQLVQNLADAFSIAYARYEDFNKLELAKGQIEKTLVDLKKTQAQLVQSEKMASLGELTAGIAHEIQNPLNFVNNFSEVSNELIEELKIKNEKLKIEDEEINELLNDIAQNLEKINHHGKRADGIVKGMLQHSRTSTGQKEPTDINVLAEEYLRLAYHGLRAKDKSFNAKFETEFDRTIDKIDLVQQDIGRVILNLINNAFYAVDEKKRQAQNGYEPMVTINTKKLDDTIEIAVKDNGNGIPKKVLDKIFQPFFTTKPTGQGTGLGLSLAYDIIKTHGGELKVDTEEGKGANFIISIPLIDKR